MGPDTDLGAEEALPSTRAPRPADAPRLSLGSWAFSFGPFQNEPWSFEKVCSYAASAGYDGVEVNGFRPHPHHADFGAVTRSKTLVDLVEGYGLAMSGYAPDLTEVPPAVVPEADYLRVIDGARAFCERTGIPILRVDTISPPGSLPEEEYAQRFARLVSTWRAAAERCSQSGITLVWEFEPGFWLNRPSEVLRLLSEVDHPSFRVLYDTSHAYTGAVAGGRQGADPELLDGGEVEYAALLRPWLGHLHLIDSDGTLHNEETSNHLPFGTGAVDFRGVLDALDPEVTSLPWWTVDFCFCPTTERDGRLAVPFVQGLADDLRGRVGQA